jgi:enamine deaminase RidA (YjgF/YER057c/UK114 family)
MEHDIATLVTDFEAGKLSRRQLISTLTVAAAATAVVAAPVASAEAAEMAKGSPIKRTTMVPGLAAPGTAAKPAYSHVTSSTRKKMIFIAGQLARDAKGNTVGKDDPKAQMRQVYENLKTALAAEGATLADVVQTSTFTTSWDKFREVGDIRAEYVSKNLPTSTAVQVVALAFPEALFEVNAIAMVDG